MANPPLVNFIIAGVQKGGTTALFDYLSEEPGLALSRVKELHFFDDETMDACLIAAGQRAEHYEMAAYGTLVAWARSMGHDEAADLLQETLDEEKAADEKLSSLAEGGINQSAADAAQAEEDDEEPEAPATGAKKSAAKGGRR